MGGEVSRTVMLSVLIVFVASTIFWLSFIIKDGNAMGAKAINEFGKTTQYVGQESLDEMKYSEKFELPAAAAFNFLEHYSKSIVTIKCIGCPSCSKSASKSEYANGYSISEGICLLNHMSGRVKMTVTDNSQYLGMYDVVLETI